MLDLALSKQDSQLEQETRMRSISPVRERTSRVGGRSKSLNRFPQAQTAKATRQPKKSSAPRNCKLLSLKRIQMTFTQVTATLSNFFKVK